MWCTRQDLARYDSGTDKERMIMQTDRLHGDVIAGISAYYELDLELVTADTEVPGYRPGWPRLRASGGCLAPRTGARLRASGCMNIRVWLAPTMRAHSRAAFSVGVAGKRRSGARLP